jgi:glycerol-3-phosphate dehydrogenase
VTTYDVVVIGGGATGAGLLRDLARRGLRCLLVERGDLGSGTSGRYHGLLHSGGRYAVRDPQAARECIEENRILRRIASACIEETGGWFVATPDDPEDYVDAFPAACATSGIDCDDVPVAELLRREPQLSPRIRRAYRVPDAALEPWQLIAANLADARAHGADVWAYRPVIGLERDGDRILAARVASPAGGVERVAAGLFVSAAGAWAGQVAALAGLDLPMAPGKGTMLVFNERMTDTVVNRCHPPGDGDIMVPVHTVAILGTTEIEVDDPDRYGIDRAEVLALLAEGEKLFPDLARRRLSRAYAGVRPLYRPLRPAPDGGGSAEPGPGGSATKDVRALSRSHLVIDHAAGDAVENLVSVVGGKLTTYRLMAEQAADLICRKLGVEAPATTADEPLPDQGSGRTYWLGHRLAQHEAAGGGDADLICECELLTRAQLERFLDAHWPCSLDDVRRGTRLGMGPCQGGFCTFRAAGLMAERHPADGRGGEPVAPGNRVAGADDGASTVAGEAAAAGTAASADAAVVDFLRERFRGGRPIAWGRQLQELWLTSGIYWGTLGAGALAASPAADVGVPDQSDTRADDAQG